MTFKRCSIGTKFAKYISPTPLHHHQPEPLRQGRMDPCFHVLYSKFWPYHLNVAAEIETHQTRQRFSNLLLSNFGEPVLNCILDFLFLADRSGTGVVFCCCSHLLQGSTCCAFRDGILHILVVTSGYLSFFCLSIISNQSVHSPLTSDINKAFSSITTAAHWIFSLFRTILCKP